MSYCSKLTLLTVMLTLSVSAYCSPTDANPTNANNVQRDRRSIILVQSPATVQEIGVFSNRTAQISFLALGNVSQPVTLSADLTQIGGILEVPQVATFLKVAELNRVDNGQQEVRFSLSIPKVFRETVFTLRLYEGTEASGDTLGTFRLRAYPEDLLEPLRKWSERNELILKDPSGKISNLFTNEKIHFRMTPDSYSASSMESSRVSQIDRNDSSRQYASAQVTEKLSILFEQSQTLLPKIIVLLSKDKTEVHAQIRLSDSPESNPVEQKMILEIFEMANAIQNRGAK